MGNQTKSHHLQPCCIGFSRGECGKLGGKPVVFPNGFFYDSLRFPVHRGAPSIPPIPTNRSPVKPRGFSQIRLAHLIQGQLGYTAQTSGGFLDVLLEVRINGLGSMGYNLLINGVYWGYNPLTNHLLTSWDIQVKSRSFAPQERFFQEINKFLKTRRKLKIWPHYSKVDLYFVRILAHRN